MQEEYVKLVLSLVSVGIVAFIGWSFRAHATAQNKIRELEKEMAALKLYLSENYVKNEVLVEIKDEMKAQSYLLHEIAGKLGIPLRVTT